MIEKYNFIPNFQTVVSTCLAFEQGKLRIEKIGVFLLLILAKYFILILWGQHLVRDMIILVNIFLSCFRKIFSSNKDSTLLMVKCCVRSGGQHLVSSILRPVIVKRGRGGMNPSCKMYELWLVQSYNCNSAVIILWPVAFDVAMNKSSGIFVPGPWSAQTRNIRSGDLERRVMAHYHHNQEDI